LTQVPHWVTIIDANRGGETPTFSRQAAKLFSEDEKHELISFLAESPLAGDVIPDTGGVRKVRFAASGKGKRGGARMIYYFHDDSFPLCALLVYAKNVKADLNPEDKRAASALARAIKTATKKR